MGAELESDAGSDLPAPPPRLLLHHTFSGETQSPDLTRTSAFRNGLSSFLQRVHTLEGGGGGAISKVSLETTAGIRTTRKWQAGSWGRGTDGPRRTSFWRVGHGTGSQVFSSVTKIPGWGRSGDPHSTGETAAGLSTCGQWARARVGLAPSLSLWMPRRDLSTWPCSRVLGHTLTVPPADLGPSRPVQARGSLTPPSSPPLAVRQSE